MADKLIHQLLIVPLFGVEVVTPLEFNIAPTEFVHRLNYNRFQKPILLNKGEAPPKNNTTTRIPIPTPATVIHIIPWARTASALKAENSLFPPNLLPGDFDIFDNLGWFAARPGPGGLGGFQTITTLSAKKVSAALLVVDFNQPCPDNAVPLSANPYESDLVESLLDAMRLYFGREPHPYKGYHITDNELLDSVIKWPLTEIQGDPLKPHKAHLSQVKEAFRQVWSIRTSARKSASCRIITLAIEYYYLSSTMTETRTIFLYLMIAFEALFKAPDEKAAGPAASRFAKLLASTKRQKNEINTFMWNSRKREQPPSCCQLRNDIVHGRTSSLRMRTYWQLRNFLRRAILQVVFLVLTNQVDRHSYYASVSKFINQRFEDLPNC